MNEYIAKMFIWFVIMAVYFIWQISFSEPIATRKKKERKAIIAGKQKQSTGFCEISNFC